MIVVVDVIMLWPVVTRESGRGQRELRELSSRADWYDYHHHFPELRIQSPKSPKDNHLYLGRKINVVCTLINFDLCLCCLWHLWGWYLLSYTVQMISAGTKDHMTPLIQEVNIKILYYFLHCQHIEIYILQIFILKYFNITTPLHLRVHVWTTLQCTMPNISSSRYEFVTSCACKFFSKRFFLQLTI